MQCTTTACPSNLQQTRHSAHSPWELEGFLLQARISPRWTPPCCRIYRVFTMLSTLHKLSGMVSLHCRSEQKEAICSS